MDIPLDSITRPSLTDTVADRILRLVRSAQFVDGDQLPPIAEMVQMFGVSPQTVRSALEKLKLVGVVDVRHGGGVYVSGSRNPLVVPNTAFAGNATKDLLLDLVEARESIEVLAVELAAVHASERSLDQLAGCLSEEVASPDDDAFGRADVEFHSAIAEASGNAVLLDLQRSLMTLFQQEQRLIHQLFGRRERDHAEHVALLEAIRRREPTLAAARMRLHLAGLRQAIEQWDG